MLAERDPSWPPNNLGIVYMNLRENQKAAATFQRATRIDSTLTSAAYNLIDVFINMNMRDSAEFYIRQYAQRFGADRPEVAGKEFFTATAFRDFEKADALLRPTPIEARSTLWRSRVNHARADMALLRGQLRAAQQQRAVAVDADVQRGNTVVKLMAELWLVGFAFASERDPDKARRLLDGALARYPIDSFPVLDRPYLMVAGSYAILGDLERADYYRQLYEQNVPVELRQDDTGNREMVAGARALHEKRWQDAIDHWRRVSERGSCTTCMDWELALAFEQAAQPDSAIGRLEHYVNTPTAQAIWEDSYKLATAYERLADLYATRGDRPNAARYAGKFVSLWQDADPELQPRVRAKREWLRTNN
jgi:tetratricopeptide (TPR) repeat protein